MLLIGSGGREHALALALRRSPLLETLFVAPGNPGIAALGECVRLRVDDHAAVVAFCRIMSIGLVVVGPERPLVAGLVDALTAAGVRAFGPSRAAARLEGSKGFTKDFCAAFGIPTAPYARFDALAPALAYIAARTAPMVVKADGLAAGKGVTMASTRAEAAAAVSAMFDGAFGAAGAAVVIEDVLEGEEASFFALCDGVRAVELGSAQDHKRVGEADTGPNTGGMGAYSPAPLMTPAMSARVMDAIIRPTLRGMAERGTPFKGVLFAGLMVGRHGPQLIEFNVRFGDPETQVILPRLQGDLLQLLVACADGALPQAAIPLLAEHALTVVLAARGYPEAPQKGGLIAGLELAAAQPGVSVLHAGTAREGGALVASGGRVLNITATGATLAQARDRAYAAVDLIDWPGGFCRRDIGRRALEGACS